MDSVLRDRMVKALLRGAKPQGHDDRGFLALEEMCCSDVDRLEPIIDEFYANSLGDKKEAQGAVVSCEQPRRDRRRVMSASESGWRATVQNADR